VVGEAARACAVHIIVPVWGNPVVLRDSIAVKVGLQLLELSVVLRKRIGSRGIVSAVGGGEEW